VLVLAASPAAADPEPLRPAITRRGWQVEFTGYVQVDSIAWSEDSFDELEPTTGQPLNDERFLIRRGRLRAEARRDGMSVAFELDGNTINGPSARILGAQVGYAYPARGAPLVAITAGLLRTPFGAEVPMRERDKPFLEPPAFARALVPGNFDAGVMLAGEYGVARWAVAMMNGAPVGDTQWQGRDPASSFELVGRIGAVIEGPRQFRVEGGVSAIAGSGFHAGEPPTKEGLQWVDDNNDGLVNANTELRVIPGSPGTPSETFDRQAIGGDLQLHWCICVIGTGTAFAEVALATNMDRGIVYADPVASSRDLRHLGFAVGFVQNITPRAFVGARYDRYNADRDRTERIGVPVVGIDQVFSTLSFMAAARWNEAKLVVEYDHERNPFGRDDNGMPTTREADRLTFRAQVGF